MAMNCPAEVIENIVQHLPLTDICSLRLSSRFFATHATQHTFKSYFVRKHLDLEKGALEKFVHLTGTSSLVCLLEDLELVGVAIDTQLLETCIRQGSPWAIGSRGPVVNSNQRCSLEELGVLKSDLEALSERKAKSASLRNSGDDVTLLSAALSNLKSNGKPGKLTSLSLDVIVLRQDRETRRLPIQNGDWKLIWRTAAHTFRTLIASLARSELPVEDLKIFDTCLRCSLAGNEFASVIPYATELAVPLSGLSSLSISVSTAVPDESEASSGSQVVRQIPPIGNNFVGLSALLGLASNLKFLKVHWYRISYTELEDETQLEHGVIETIAGSPMLPVLRECHLKGVLVEETSLVRFLQRARIKRLGLDNVNMRHGTFAAVFAYCTSDEAGMEYLHFDDLWERGLVYFEESRVKKFSHSVNPNGGPTLERSGANVRKPIRYHFPPGRVLDSPEARQWGGQRRTVYGPSW